MLATFSKFATRLLSPLLLVASLACPVYASTLLDAAQDLQPNENGLPPPLEKPLYISVCLFDMQGKNGEIYNKAKDLALIARRWNIHPRIDVYSDERVAAESFKAGRCDAAGISTMRARQFNLFIGSIEALGAVTSYQELRTLLITLLDTKLLPLTITEPYQIVGVLPIGSTYVHVRDKQINSIEKAAGKKIAVLDWDKSQTEIVSRIGAQAVPSDLSNIAGKFNNGQVDIIVAPALVFKAFELERGLGDKGGVYRFPLTQMTGSLVINRDRIKKKMPDLDEKLVAFRSIAAQFLDEILNQTYKAIERSEAEIPAKYWVNVTPEEEIHYWGLLREARIEMTKLGYYDPKMMALLKRIRCKSKPTNAECSLSDE
ncbi:putative solute-binding protein [Agitococcus lubricus]|uniref:TRAP-type C4-dicarboxylate transport system substrate-binding protein n=1 Tax=Agitococcus lubricus TaxID=1077255 RepID=A0A2T5J1W3_9GAMM|nr:putative solute-binding protein [Agitococcus lubricus]PTQ90424.1 hypothetical protein C8N29_103177 [Agitococcus lubricus]